MEDDLRPRLIAEGPGSARTRALRGFGIGLGFVLCFFAFRSWRHHHAVPAWSALSVLSWLVAAVRPSLFAPIYDPWMKVVAVLARVNTWLICALLYYVVVTPYALLLRLFGTRPLELALREKPSYWDEKPPRDPAESARSPF